MYNLLRLIFVILVAIFTISCEDERDELIQENNNKSEVNNNTDDNKLKEGVYIDNRDGKSYRVILQNGYWWMIDNFAFEYKGNSSTSSYWTGAYADYNGDGRFDEKAIYKYYDNKAYKPAPGDKESGMLYTYTTAVNAAPSGWRLPTWDEWKDFKNSSNVEAQKYYPDNVHQSNFVEIKDGAAPQLLGLRYNENAYPSIWSSTLHKHRYPNGDDRDSYVLISRGPGSAVVDGAHYKGHTVRYITGENNFTP